MDFIVVFIRFWDMSLCKIRTEFLNIMSLPVSHDQTVFEAVRDMIIIMGLPIAGVTSVCSDRAMHATTIPRFEVYSTVITRVRNYLKGK